MHRSRWIGYLSVVVLLVALNACNAFFARHTTVQRSKPLSPVIFGKKRDIVLLIFIIHNNHLLAYYNLLHCINAIYALELIQ